MRAAALPRYVSTFEVADIFLSRQFSSLSFISSAMAHRIVTQVLVRDHQDGTQGFTLMFSGHWRASLWASVWRGVCLEA